MKSFQDIELSLDQLFNQLGSLIQAIDVDGQLLYANQQWLETLGYDAAACEDLNFYSDILHPIERPTFDALHEQLLCGDCLVDVELALLTQKGKTIVADGSLVPRLDDAGNLQTIIGVFRNVTDDREFETELHRMFEISVDMLAIVGYDGIFQKLNPAWERVLGYSVEEMAGCRFIDFVHPDDRELTYAQAITARDERSIVTFENRYRCKDGSYKWLSWHSSPYDDKEQFYCVVRDMTDRKETEFELEQARHRLQSILDNSGTVISIKDTDGCYLLVNTKFAERFGNGRKESFVGMSDGDVFAPEVVKSLRAHDQEVLTSNRATQFEERLPGEEGIHTYLATKFPLQDMAGMPYAVCTIATDITYRKLTETQLLLRNQAIEYSPSGISIADATLPDMPLIYINPAFERKTGYTALDAIGRNCRFLQGDDRDQSAIEEMREAIANEKSVTVVVRNYRKDGTLFYNELSLAPIHNNDGMLTHYVGISTDVTDRVEAEDKIQRQNEELVVANHELAVARKQAENAAHQIQEQNEKLIAANHELAIARKQAEDATRLKSQFLATMSHELRTPLNAIIGYTEIQLAGMTGDLAPEQRDYQERVLANADHLLELINDVLDIAKIEAGRTEIVKKAFNLQAWLDDIVAQIKVLTEEKDIRLDVDLDARMPTEIVGDPARIRQITINLLSNAIKFTDDGHVGLHIRKHGRDAWKLIVEDDGIGIPSHMQETIFEEFRQVDGSSQRKAGGTGLGLAIVRKLALMMGGNIRLKSQVGEGSTFTVFLPMEEKTEAVPDA